MRPAFQGVRFVGIKIGAGTQDILFEPSANIFQSSDPQTLVDPEKR
jgi:hypothetical protein